VIWNLKHYQSMVAVDNTKRYYGQAKRAISNII